MSLDRDAFRSVLGRFASGITVITTCDAAGRDHGMTVSAFCSVSLTPPLVLVCIAQNADMYGVLQEASHFTVNILASHQEAISRRFADLDAEQRFEGVGFRRGKFGAPVLHDILAYVECTVVNRYDAGDHGVVIGEVEHAAARDDRPLLYYRGGYARLER
ncbi:MAG TPA: flavin reductase family protein [Gemmatimonadaceae bacterium]|nr:flavin reductase family protein [Gemmatimonadaceae bacterium]